MILIQLFPVKQADTANSFKLLFDSVWIIDQPNDFP